MGANEFGKLLGKKIRHEFKDVETEIYGDPSGDYRSQSDDNTPFLMLSMQKINAIPAPTNDPVVRRESIITNLQRLTTDGKPGMVLSPKCKMFRKGLSGGFKYKRIQVTGEERYKDEPDKNIYSHVCDLIYIYLICMLLQF